MKSILFALAILLAAFYCTSADACVLHSRSCRMASGRYYVGKVIKEKKPIRAMLKGAGCAVVYGLRAAF